MTKPYECSIFSINLLKILACELPAGCYNQKTPVIGAWRQAGSKQGFHKDTGIIARFDYWAG